MSKGQVNLIRQLKKLLGNAHADINNINLQKNTNIFKKTRRLSNKTEILFSEYVDYIKEAYKDY